MYIHTHSHVCTYIHIKKRMVELLTQYPVSLHRDSSTSRCSDIGNVPRCIS